VREFRLHGFGRGAVSNDRPYRASVRVIPGLTHFRPTSYSEEPLSLNHGKM